MAKAKSKLEEALDDMEDELERGKHSRSELEKMRRKVENDLRLAQESLDHVERERKEMEAAVGRKNREIASLGDKLETEQSQVTKGLKQIKECGV